MDVTQTTHGALTVLRPEAPLLEASAAAFAAVFDQTLARSMGRLAVDCSRVTYVDSPGLEALVIAAERLAEAGHSLKLFAVNDTLREVFELTDTAHAMEFYEDAGAAARSLL